MGSFYLKTDRFWLFSRILFTLLFIAAVIIVLFDSDFEPKNIIGYSIFGIYISLMILISVRRTYKKPISSTVKMTTGILSIIIGFLMSYTILTNDEIDELLKVGFHFFPVWIILLGLRDILLYQNDIKVKSKGAMTSE